MKGGKRGWHEWSGQMAWRGDYDIKNVLAAVTSEPDVVIRSLISPFDSDGSSGISLSLSSIQEVPRRLTKAISTPLPFKSIRLILPI